MLKRLSSCQKEIALSLIALFFITGLSSLKAQLINESYAKIYLPGYTGGHHDLPANEGRPNDIGLLPADSMGSGTTRNNLKPATNLAKVKSENFSRKSGPENLTKTFIGGPTQPEMSGFKSVGSDNMVSPFTGDFSYNIPLLDVGGYPINMFYSSGIAMDQESSWLGLGWNINPGTITRNMRGLPDDFDGSDEIVKTQSFRDDISIGLTTGAGIKLAGFPLVGLDASWGLSWNNKLGLAAEAGINAALSMSAKNGSLKTAMLTVGAGLNASSRNGASVSPSISIQKELSKGESGTLNGTIGVGFNYSSRQGLSSMHLDKDLTTSGSYNGDSYSNTWQKSSATLSFAYPSIMPSITKPLTRQNYSLNFSMGSEFWALNAHFKLNGYYSRTYLAPDDKLTRHRAYGMLYLQKGDKDRDGLLDFNRANDGVYTPSSPAIAMPVYTYDVFSINGEGTGGSFRAYRGDVGHMHDAYVKTKENQFGAGVDLGFGNTVHVGAELSYVYSPTEAGDWALNNMASSSFGFQNNNEIYQAAYFKNPGEKTVPDQIFQNAMANEDLVRLKMANTASANPMLLPRLMRYDGNKNLLGEKAITAADTKKINRDKRTQVISFLTAEESERIAMNRKLYSYNAQGADSNHIIYSANCNKAGVDSFYRDHDGGHDNLMPILGGEINKFRKHNHISEIDVLGSDGKKYVYGLPVYNKRQVNVTFAINANQKQSESKAIYEADDNTINNGKGRDWIMEKEEMPAYTHSYLLTELVTPNYVDVTGNGISEDDMGDAVKFNYSKYEDYKWRTPGGLEGEERTASYSAGLKTDDKDDKAHYIYGEREAWYLYSVESKNMVARFYVKSGRNDGRPVLNEDGALDTDLDKGMRRLDRISLYSKGDLAKSGDAAKPIKTIRFFQSYKLCKNNPALNNLGGNIIQGQGKLTLDSIWITYNGNQSKPKSRYVFYYPDNTNNPEYNFDQSDRWGTYKPNADNPGNPKLENQDFPYSIQDKVKADKNAAAWTMNKILLPSGGVISVDYEADVYAYVQNKTAASMCQVLGFGMSTGSLPASGELNKLYANGGAENEIVYIQLPYAITATGPAGGQEFAARYLADVKQLYLKLAVTMPMGPGLTGIAGDETISVYADFSKTNGVNYGLISSTIAWIRVNSENGHTPMVQAALQFLMQQLPGKAYKGYDLGDAGPGKSVIMAMASMLGSIGTLIRGELDQLKADKKCQFAVLNKSFAKIANPTRNKLGGGVRVKRITISDNWQKMTNQTKATYGQEYVYTTTELINGKPETISSGVASWEPSLGGDENPHREIMRYVNHNRGGPYDYGAIEIPLGEMFYPAAMVGYSRVEVLSIHRDTVKNLPTRQVTEFYTNKDFPYKSSATDLVGDANSKYEPAKILQLLRIDMMKGVAQSQGFLIETNDMHGKEKSHATYTAADPNNPVSYTQNFYNTKQVTDKSFGFNHNFSTIGNADGKVTNSIIGRDIELMTDFRQHRSETITANLSINFDAFIVGFFPIPLFNLLTPVIREGTSYRSASVLKVVTHYGMLDSVVVIDKGSMVSTKNLVYDAETGNPLLTRTNNEHKKPIYNFSYPAHWAYSGMGPAYKNIDAVYSNLDFRHGILTNPPSEIFNILESGDEIYVVKQGNDTALASVPCDDPAALPDAWTTLKKNSANRIWAVNTAKAGEANPNWVFMDANGNPYNAAVNMTTGKGANIRIVRSGKRNMLDQSIASITSLVDPRVTTGNVTQLVFDEAKNIVQTSAATFKDNWRVDNSFYRVVEQIDNSTYARVKKLDIEGPSFLNIRWQHEWRESGSTNYHLDLAKQVNTNSSMLLSKSQDHYKQHGNWYRWEDRKTSFLLYDYSSIPSGAKFYKALLSLYSHTNSLFNTSSHPSAKHDPVHTANNAQNSAIRLGEINALNNIWFGTNPDPWIDNYLRPGNAVNLSAGKSIIPYASTNGWDNYYFGNTDTRLNISLPLLTNSGSPLALQKKIGLKIKLDIDETDIGNGGIYYRCFWSPTAAGIKTGFFASPILSYYYYVCGDTNTVSNSYPIDPSVNVMIKCLSSIVTASFCKSKFVRKAINPYVEGILGNWRVDSTYAYYGERKEDDLSTAVDTRTGGAIKDYKGFWDFAATPGNPQTPVYMSRNMQASDVWVWNSAITQYNRKGYEIENTDPLGRFNSGLYGYNQQLPIAVANNSRVREVLFDGYEDYDYQTSTNCIDCQPHRHFNYTSSVQIDATQKHSGKYSLRVDAGQSVKIKAPVTTITEADRFYGLKIKSRTISYTNISVGGGTAGMGLKASWYNHVPNNGTIPLEPPNPVTNPPVFTNTTAVISVPLTPPSPATGITPEFFSVKWEGKIQAPATGTFYFRPSVLDDGYRLTINGSVLSSNQQWTNGYGNTAGSTGYAMIVGQTYTIEIVYYNWRGNHQFQLLWKTPNDFMYRVIPQMYLYTPTATAFQTVQTSQLSCNRLDSSQVIGNALTDSFSLIQNKKMLLGAWVKVGTAICCFPATYNNNSNSITISYNGSGTATETMKPAGTIIEGWQRYEAVFDIPTNAVDLTVLLNNLTSGGGAAAVFFDDLRLQPYNANMKSFVYHSSNLRLMAELDENNYASFYEYDDDGTLARVKKETQRGIKTITETRSATQKKIAEE